MIVIVVQFGLVWDCDVRSICILMRDLILLAKRILSQPTKTHLGH